MPVSLPDTLATVAAHLGADLFLFVDHGDVAAIAGLSEERQATESGSLPRHIGRSDL